MRSLTGPTADRNVTESSALSPVTAARLAEVARLREVIIVVVAEFGAGGVASRARQRLGQFGWWVRSHGSRDSNRTPVAGISSHFCWFQGALKQVNPFFTEKETKEREKRRSLRV